MVAAAMGDGAEQIPWIGVSAKKRLNPSPYVGCILANLVEIPRTIFFGFPLDSIVEDGVYVGLLV